MACKDGEYVVAVVVIKKLVRAYGHSQGIVGQFCETAAVGFDVQQTSLKPWSSINGYIKQV